MKTVKSKQIDTYWDGLVERMQRLKKLDLSNEAHLEEALEESQRLLGAIAHCRHMLTQIEPQHDGIRRMAA